MIARVTGGDVSSSPSRAAILRPSSPIAGREDKLDHPSIAWPKDRRIVELGTISIANVVADNGAAQKTLLFLPSALPPGIEPEDPMINVRSAAYPISYERRQ
ncbi:MAG: hypothetical protein JO356_14455 [Acidobacteria bacterium]|nr:hypothetical protein [Acidobacteriota bacterium]